MEILCRFVSNASPKALNADLNALLLIVPVQYNVNFMPYFLNFFFLRQVYHLSQKLFIIGP
jgi:hypothetical protein